MFAINVLIKIKETADFFSDFILNLITFLQPFFKKDILFFIDKDEKNTELVDSFSLFEKALQKGLKAYYIILKTHPSYKKIKSKYKSAVLAYDKNLHIRHFLKFLRLSKFFTSFGMQNNLHRFFYKNKFIDYIFLDHGIILLKNNIFNIYNRNEYNKILVSNDYEAKIVKKYGGFEDKNLIKAALPRFDNLKKTHHGYCKSIFFFFTWRLSFNTVDYKKSMYYKAICELFNDKALISMLRDNNTEINAALHHALLERNSDFSFCENIKLHSSLDISRLIKTSDMLITDYSSIWSDFFFLNKPVIFYRPDTHDKNLIQRDIEDMSFAKQSDSLLFNITESRVQLIDMIEKYIKKNFELEEEFRTIQDKFFYTKENIREKILRELGCL